MPLRPAQYGVLFAVLLWVLELGSDAHTLVRLSHTPSSSMSLVFLLLIIVPSVIEGLMFVGARDSVAFLLTATRIQPMIDGWNVVNRPSYQALHPLFASPYFMLCEAVVKAVPQAIFHTVSIALSVRDLSPAAATVTTAFELAFSVGGFVLSLVSISVAVTSFELGDFKQRQILKQESFLSAKFIKTACFRFTELAAQITIIAVLAITTGSTYPALIVGILLLVFLGLIMAGPTREVQFEHRLLASIVSIFVYCDVRLDYGREPAVKPWLYLTMRNAIHAVVVVHMLAMRGHDGYFLLVALLSLVYLLLTPAMYANWSQYKILRAVLSTPEKQDRTVKSPPRTPATAIRDSQSTPLQKQLYTELSQSPVLMSRLKTPSPIKPAIIASPLSRARIDSPSVFAHPSPLRPRSERLPAGTPAVRQAQSSTLQSSPLFLRRKLAMNALFPSSPPKHMCSDNGGK